MSESHKGMDAWSPPWGLLNRFYHELMVRSSTNFIGVIVYTSSGRTDYDRAMAVTMLDESLAITTELGMRPLMERVLSRREILRA